MQGTAGGLIGDGLTFRIQGGDGASNQFCPHVITPIAPAETVFSYVDLPVAGGAAQTLEPQPVHDALSGMSHQELPWPGDATSGAGGSLQPLSHLNSGPAALRVDTGEYGLVYFAFGFEAIDSLAMRQEVMLRVLGWLGTLGSFVQGEVEFQGNMEGFGARVLLACGAVEIAGVTEPDGTFSVRTTFPRAPATLRRGPRDIYPPARPMSPSWRERPPSYRQCACWSGTWTATALTAPGTWRCWPPTWEGPKVRGRSSPRWGPEGRVCCYISSGSGHWG